MNSQFPYLKLMNFRIIITIVGLAFIHSTEIQFNATASGFPKVIWSYWEQGIDSVPFFTKLCLANKDQQASTQGWKHIILQRKNLHEYIDPNEVEMYFQMAMPASQTIQLRADLIRLLLILKYGGLWVDVNSYFLTDFSWV